MLVLTQGKKRAAEERWGYFFLQPCQLNLV